MKTLYKASTCLILALGVVHISMTPVFFGSFTPRVLWFVSGGLMIIFLSFLNFILMTDAGKQRVVRILAHSANLISLVFACFMVVIESRLARAGLATWIVMALLIFETVAAFRYSSRLR